MQTRNELQTLEGIVSQDISCFMEMKCAVDDDLLRDFRHAILEETERVKSNIILTVCSVSKKTELKRYVQHHQQALIRLSSHLLKYTDPEKIVSESRVLETTLLCHYVYRSLEDLLNFVERHFAGYFNPDSWIPANYRQIAVYEIRYDLEILKQNLSMLKIDDKLVQIIFLSFMEFLEEEFSNEITYRRVNYLRTLKKELAKAVQKDRKTKDINESIRVLLIKLNFNSNEYFNYCTNQIASQVNHAKTQSSKLNKLAFCLKEINQVRDKSGFIFDPRYKSLKEQIAGWLVEELNFQESNHQLEIGFAEGENSVQLMTKIDLDLSVAQIACMARGFVEIGIIRNKNLSELIRLIVSIVRTKRSERISADSFRMRYYNVEDNVRLAVAARLRAIAEYLSKT